jgi:cobalt-zinc-cadmium efflux system outer membrane protein
MTGARPVPTILHPSNLRRRLSSLLAAGVMFWPALVGGQEIVPPEAEDVLEGDSLRLAPAIDEALARNPGLRAVRSGAAAAGARVDEEGTLPDPVLQVGAMNVGLPDLDVGMPASMFPSIQLSQSFPAFGTRGLREEVAAARATAMELDVSEAAWRLRAEVAAEFHALYALDRTLEVHRRTLDLLTDFQSVARSLYAAGAGRQGDVLRADVEVARMDAEIRRITALRTTRAAALNALLDRPGDSPVPPAALPPLPSDVPPLDSLVVWAARSRPALAREEMEVEAARKAVELADRSRWPDLTVSAQYGHRGGSDPRHMGGLMVGAALPIHSGSRQGAFLEASRAEAQGAEARLSALRADVEAEVRSLLAEQERARSLLGLYRDEILPVARVNVASSLAAYRVGSVDFSTLVDAQLDVDRYELEYHTLEADYGTALARLESALGRTLPFTGTLPTGFDPEAP